MSPEELNRLQIIKEVKAKQTKQITAAKKLKLSPRQVRRLIREYERKGAEGLISKHYGKRGNNRIADWTKEESMNVLKTHYADFGPTLAHEKLTEVHGFQFSVETLRQWMIEEGLWKGKKRRKAHIHQQRERRSRRGELVQIDGSPHDWFEGRRGKCCLLVFVDDASSEIMTLHFVEQECLQGYFDAVKHHVLEHGVALAYYSDKHSIFRIHIKEAESGTGETQFGRALSQLGIALICANSPQAKGRVEKTNQTLQDRLVKELRLSNICDINTANAFLPGFIKDYNRRFGVAPIEPLDAHRPLRYNENELNQILAEHHERIVSKNLEISYKNVIYQIQSKQNAYTLRKAKVTICDHQGEISLIYKGKPLAFNIFDKGNQPVPVADSKAIQATVLPRGRKKIIPSANHPWRKGSGFVAPQESILAISKEITKSQPRA